MNKLDMESKDIIDSNIEKLKELFPSCVQEDKIDFDMLKQELSSVVIDDKKEKYQLTWPGKKEAIVLSNQRINKTLRPIREKSVNFDNTENIYIEGDNLEALKILQESYLNKIKCIYIDPPYNTGNDFIYNDKFTKKENDEFFDNGRIDEEGNILISKDINNFSNGKFHSDWLSMLYPRLKLARNLLSNDGVIFISIDDNEQSNLKKMCDEIFGESNYIGTICWQKKTQPSFLSKKISSIKEYIIFYCKNNPNSISTMGGFTDENKLIEMINISNQKGERLLKKENVLIENGKFNGTLLEGIYGNGDLQIELRKKVLVKNGKPLDDIILYGRFKWNQDTMNNSFSEGDIYHIKNVKSLRPTVEKKNKTIGIKPILDLLSKKLNDEIPTNTDATNEIKRLFDGYGIMDYPKPSKLIKYLIRAVTYDEKNSIILDFFSGSGTTADSVMQQNVEDNNKRKYIVVQIPEKYEYSDDYIKTNNICDLGEERIRRAGKKIKEETNANIDYGFRVYKVDSSNMKDVYYKPSELGQTNLFDMMSNIKEDRTPEDLLTQVMLDLRLTLDLKIEEKTILNNKVYYVADNALVACFDDNIDINIIDEICKCKPLKVVFKDMSFKSDKDKINLEERVKKLSPDTEISIL